MRKEIAKIVFAILSLIIKLPLFEQVEIYLPAQFYYQF